MRENPTKYHIAISFPDNPLWLKGWKHRQPVWTEDRGEAKTYTGQGASWVCTHLKAKIYAGQNAAWAYGREPMVIPTWLTPEEILANRKSMNLEL